MILGFILTHISWLSFRTSSIIFSNLSITSLFITVLYIKAESALKMLSLLNVISAENV